MSLQFVEIEPSPPGLLSEPIDYIFAEHYRQRQICHNLEAVAEAATFAAAPLAELLDYLRYDLELHVIDEEEDLFPLLRRRCLPEDEIDRALGLLSAEHAADRVLAREVRDGLEACRLARRPPAQANGLADTLRSFAHRERRHVALENAVVLPIARLRLTVNDQAVLARRMAARRGLMLDEPA